MTNQQPIKLQDNLYLYSGDIITIDNSDPLLVEIIDDQTQTVKLRSVKKNKYLSGKIIGSSLDFSSDFENALIFTIEKNDSKISLKASDKYLKLDNKDFRLLSEVK